LSPSGFAGKTAGMPFIRPHNFKIASDYEPTELFTGREAMQKLLSILPSRELLAEVLLSAFRSLSLALCSLGLFATIAAAQQPTDAQRNAIRAACRSDFIAQCSGVTPGGREALQCLQQHNATISKACQKAIAAITGAASPPATPAPAATPATAPAAAPATAPAPAAVKTTAAAPSQAQRNAIKSACRSDFMAQCSGVQPGGQAALSCLQQHDASLSASCQQAVAAIGGGGAAASAAPAAAMAPAAPAMRSMPSFTPRQEIFVMRQACGADFQTYCGSVPLGRGRGIACLRQNIQRVSPSCKQVLTSGL
jgi:hypothetical protein